MKTQAVFTAALLTAAASSNAYTSSGTVHCDANLNGISDGADTPVPGVLVVVTNSTGSVSNANWTTAQGIFVVSLPDTPGSYKAYLHPLTLPAGTTAVIPASHSFQLSAGTISDNFAFVIRNTNCVAEVTTIHYVRYGNPVPVPPYANWATAATNIQDAIDIANPGDTIIVTNGVYRSGGRVAHGSLLNRVALTKPLLVKSVNGPALTTIEGYTGNGSTRCAYLTNGATLSGFTLTNGFTIAISSFDEDQDGAGAWCESQQGSLTNCVLVDNNAHGWGGGTFRGSLQDCTLTGNSAGLYGGAAYETRLENCRLRDNHAELGGGAYSSTLIDCDLSTNSVVGRNSHGGGVSYSTLVRCTLTANSAASQAGGGAAAYSTLLECDLLANTCGTGGGGAAYFSSLHNCVLRGNSASGGGAAYRSGLTNCLLTGNSAIQGGGLFAGLALNCTIVSNSATSSGGGIYTTAVTNSIVWNNSAPEGSNYTGGLFEFSCTAPLPVTGVGNIAANPLFVSSSDFHLQAGSPCINTGTDVPVYSATDLDGQPRVVGGRVDMGAYEYQGTGPSSFLNWLALYGLPTDGSADYADTDLDKMPNHSEWIAGTNPTNTASVLKLLLPLHTNQSVVVSWQSVAGKTYFVQSTTNLSQPFQTILDNVQGQQGWTTVSNAARNAECFRVGVKTGDQ